MRTAANEKELLELTGADISKTGRSAQGSLIELDYNCGCDADGGEGVGASAVAGGDAPPVLQRGEQVLDPVPPAVESPVVRDGDLAAASGENAGLDPSLC
jgi:hypothetical protein